MKSKPQSASCQPARPAEAGDGSRAKHDAAAPASFSSRWRGHLKPAAREGERHDELAKKYLSR